METKQKRNRKRISSSLDVELYEKLKHLAFDLTSKYKRTVNTNELLEEGMKYVLEKYNG